VCILKKIISNEYLVSSKYYQHHRRHRLRLLQHTARTIPCHSLKQTRHLLYYCYLAFFNIIYVSYNGSRRVVVLDIPLDENEAVGETPDGVFPTVGKGCFEGGGEVEKIVFSQVAVQSHLQTASHPIKQ